MTKTTKLALLAIVFLAGCKHHDCSWEAQGEHTEHVFSQCLKDAGPQPNNNHEDNNGDIVRACQSASSSMTGKVTCHDYED